MATRFVVLLRSVNVGGRALPMAELRAALTEAGFRDCASYIQSGNLVFTAEADGPAVERAIEALIVARFGLTVSTIAHEADDFARIAAANPLPAAAPKALHLVLAKQPIAEAAAAVLAARATMGEQVVLAGGGLWINYAGGVGRSKLTPALLDRAAGSPATARNANTVAQLVALAKAG